jgi:hypothetical protein
MKPPAIVASVPPAEPGELDALLCAISDAIAALVAWNLTAFQAAIERQSAICEHLALKPEWRQLPGTAVTARQVQELNRVYDRLLRHSVHWTNTIQSILQAGGHTLPSHASVHFRG